MKTFKRFIFIMCFISIAFTLTSQSIKRLETVDIRSTSMGAKYYTDTESLYSLYNNPAALAFTGDKKLWIPLVSVITGGELLNIMELSNLITDGTSTTVELNTQEDVTEAVDKYNTFLTDVEDFIGPDGYNASLKIGGPLTFGAIKNNFGWGFANTIEIGAKMNVDGTLISFDVPDVFETVDLEQLSKSGSVVDTSTLDNAITIPLVATLDINTDFVLGYALPLDFGPFGVLSIGLSARGISQFSFLLQDDIKSLYTNENSLDPFKIPLAMSFGMGLDMGLQYKIFDMIHVALVWQDFFSPIWSKTMPVGQAMTSSTAFNYSTLDSQLGLGASIDIPLEDYTFNVISHSAVYANYKDFLQLARNAQSNDLYYRDPLLDLAVGTELVLFDVLALRFGMNQLYPAGGIGLYIGTFRLDVSAHNEELGYKDEKWRQLNLGLSITFQK